MRLQPDRRVDGTGRDSAPPNFSRPDPYKRATSHRPRSRGTRGASTQLRVDASFHRFQGPASEGHRVVSPASSGRSSLSSLIPLRLGQPQGTSRDAALFAARFRSTPLSGDLVELGPVAIGEKRPGITLGLEMAEVSVRQANGLAEHVEFPAGL